MMMDKKTHLLPKDFLMGGALSALQSEGAWDQGGKGLASYEL